MSATMLLPDYVRQDLSSLPLTLVALCGTALSYYRYIPFSVSIGGTAPQQYKRP